MSPPPLKGSRTEAGLKQALSREALANRLYLYFAQKADIEGLGDISALLRSTAEGETGHAFGHLEFLEEVGDPISGLPIGETQDNLAAALAGELADATEFYPDLARTARQEGFLEIAEWFERLAKAEQAHAKRLQKALDSL